MGNSYKMMIRTNYTYDSRSNFLVYVTNCVNKIIFVKCLHNEHKVTKITKKCRIKCRCKGFVK